MKKEELTKYEFARILGARALQISMNAPILIKLNKEELKEMNYDPLKIAEIEIDKGVLPISVKRPLPEKIEEETEDEKEETEEKEPEEEPKIEIEELEDEKEEISDEE